MASRFEDAMEAQPHPLLIRAIPAAETLIQGDNFSLENLCHALDCSLRELAEAVGSVDELILHVNDRFMASYIEKAMAVDASCGGDDLKALQEISLAWLEYAQAHPRQIKVLLQHRWSPGFMRPDWYMARVASCFVPSESRLQKLAPHADAKVVRTAARAIYAQICGLFFLSANERATPAGIASQQQLLLASIAWLAKGL
jgi:hypothetical protein